METITATVVRMGPDWGDGKGVVNLMGEGGVSITAIGPVYGFTPGQSLELQGFWKGQDSDRFGRQFVVKEATVGRPQIGPGLIEWLAQAPGIGKITAKHIVKHFDGMDAEQLLETIKDPTRLEEIEGIGPAKAKSVSAGSKKRGERDQLTMDLRDKGVPLAAVARVLRKFGDNAPEVVQRYPYSLLQIKGIGFKTADEIALASGFVSHGSYQRIQAGIVEVLDQAARKGHVYLPIRTLLTGKGKGTIGATRLLTLKESTVSDKLSRIEESGRIHIDDGSVYLDKNHRQEQVIAIRLSDLSTAKVSPIETGLKPGQLMEITPENGKPFTLSHDQNYAVITACNEPVMVITGGPGVGKTALTCAIVHTWLKSGLSIELCAPTGRAAKRLSEATGHRAKTIHRLLEYGPQGFARSRNFPLDCQALIVDETSMLDTALAARLFDALPIGCRVVIVGDQDQLPSIGCGTVLRDVIRSTKIPVIRLDKVFRQSEGSRIVTNAHRFVKEQPLKYPEHGENSDFWFHRKNGAEDIVQALGDFLTKHIPAKFGLDPLNDVMVLTPQNQGPLGTIKLNLYLQNLLNPDGQKLGNRPLRVGDRCMQIRNNYELDVFNGDVGSVLSWDARKKQAWVKFGTRDVLYCQNANIGGLVPAYASTVHKCVAPETLVCTEKGIQEIQEINRTGQISTAKGSRPYNDKFSIKEQLCVEITTKHGYQVTVSLDHKMMSWNGTEYAETKAADLLPGSFLRLPLFWGGTGELSLPKLKNAFCRFNAKKYPTPKVMSGQLALLLGLLVADGTLYGKGFRLAKRHKETADEYARLCRAILGAKPLYRPIGETPCYEVNSSHLARWLRQIGGMGPKAKAVPKCILESSSGIQANFLRGLFEDGGVNIKGTKIDHIEWSTCSKAMSSTVQIMLLRLGIASSRALYGTNWRLSIYSEFIRVFKSKIGFVSHSKNSLLELPVPSCRQLVVPVNPASLDQQDKGHAKNRGTISRQLILDRYAPLRGSLNFFHSPISEIKPVKSRTFCLNVLDHHRFIQNGFDGSNSQGAGFPAVIGIIDQSHQWMLRANLVYTMITRAEQLLVLIGQRGALERASRNRQDMDRFTGLAEKLLHPPVELPELSRAEMISNRLYVCDACQRTLKSLSARNAASLTR